MRWTDDRDEAADALWVTRATFEVRVATMYGGEQAAVQRELLSRGLGLAELAGDNVRSSSPTSVDTLLT